MQSVDTPTISLTTARAARRAKRLRGVAVAALVVACLLWGTSFATIKICGRALVDGAGADVSPAFGPLLLTALRFTAAVPLVWAFCIWRRLPLRLDRSGLTAVLKVGLPMAVGFLSQGPGLAYTTATISAFLTSLIVLLTPVLEWCIWGKGTTLRLAIAVALATLGAALMTLHRGPVSFGFGEILTLVGVVAYSFQVLWTGKAAQAIGAAALTLGTFIITALASWIILLVSWPARIVPAIAVAGMSGQFWELFAVLVVGGTIGAMVLMNLFQQYVRPTEAAIIYTTEPVFAAIFAWTLCGADEILGLRGLIGAALMLLADVLAAVRKGEGKGVRKGER